MGNEIFKALTQVASLLDKANGSNKYQKSVTEELAKINDASLTPSARLLDLVVNQGESLTRFALTSAGKYREVHLDNSYQFYDENTFVASVAKSHRDQAEIEAGDELNYDDFLKEYFAK